VVELVKGQQEHLVLPAVQQQVVLLDHLVLAQGLDLLLLAQRLLQLFAEEPVCGVQLFVEAQRLLQLFAEEPVHIRPGQAQRIPEAVPEQAPGMLGLVALAMLALGLLVLAFLGAVLPVVLAPAQQAVAVVQEAEAAAQRASDSAVWPAAAAAAL
jgi:hypothetical protein